MLYEDRAKAAVITAALMVESRGLMGNRLSKLINEIVAVTLDAVRKVPASFVWRGRTYRIRQVDRVWKRAGEWWHGDDEVTFYRLTTSDLSTFELEHRSARNLWVLQRLYD